MDLLRLLYTDRSMRKWAETRAKGRTRFVWLVGVGCWGGIMCATMTAFKLSEADRLFSFSDLLRDLGIWAVAGYAWGAATWALNEKIFARFGAPAR